jgi:uncharacterized protein YaaR (DUF327 family)
VSGLKQLGRMLEEVYNYELVINYKQEIQTEFIQTYCTGICQHKTRKLLQYAAADTCTHP